MVGSSIDVCFTLKIIVDVGGFDDTQINMGVASLSIHSVSD
ncbi:hypothetical protein XBKQ1_2600002 [Xenorhabdus bovienii str. kraussei Quebec]|uniref:Uncharacterized protein n=1 Tax=Xenorhabdus bovienii str. kraussei Quebec TaxID=1398203 RepID=A0A077P781_XENBV|nr:hypothetical protein XBKQ1_2600002 [Xenorhabdus bovienii str. kraussei Quebec]